MESHESGAFLCGAGYIIKHSTQSAKLHLASGDELVTSWCALLNLCIEPISVGVDLEVGVSHYIIMTSLHTHSRVIIIVSIM